MSSFVPITMFVSLNCFHRLYSYASSQQGYLKMVRVDQLAANPLSPFLFCFFVFSSFLVNVRISGVIHFHSSFPFLHFPRNHLHPRCATIPQKQYCLFSLCLFFMLDTVQIGHRFDGQPLAQGTRHKGITPSNSPDFTPEVNYHRFVAFDNFVSTFVFYFHVIT